MRKSEKSAALFFFFKFFCAAPQLIERLEEASPVEDLDKVLQTRRLLDN